MVDLSKTLTDAEMFKIIMEEVRRMRETNEVDHKTIRAELSKIREDHAGERVKMKGITAGISVVVAGVVTWIIAHLSR